MVPLPVQAATPVRQIILSMGIFSGYEKQFDKLLLFITGNDHSLILQR